MTRLRSVTAVPVGFKSVLADVVGEDAAAPGPYNVDAGCLGVGRSFLSFDHFVAFEFAESLPSTSALPASEPGEKVDFGLDPRRDAVDPPGDESTEFSAAPVAPVPEGLPAELEFDDEPEPSGDDPPEGWAHATPWPVKTAAPTPSATASPPTRPINLEARIASSRLVAVLA
ncbi:MAG TPA: hypothetical protein VH496_03710 [Mycobacterium sp.]